MDISGRESAAEPDVVMDSNEDFEPGESEDEAVPQNIEIARNLQKTQTDMVKQVGRVLFPTSVNNTSHLKSPNHPDGHDQPQDYQRVLRDYWSL